MAHPDQDRLRHLAREHGQEHVLHGEERLADAVRQRLFDQLASIDWEELARLKELLGRSGVVSTPELAPAPSIAKGRDDAADARAKERGESLLRDGKVAAFVVAGGQGSRLGFEGPKGLYPATPVRDKCLFQVFAEKIRAVGRRYGKTPHWFVMTSQANDDATRHAFGEAKYFGLDPSGVSFFAQSMLPALDPEGRMLLADTGELFMSPNGHGGSLLALRQSGALDRMRDQNIEQIFYFQVDNPLVQIGDPVFLGYHDEASAQMSTKVVSKRDAQEKVGVVGLIDGRYGVIEYSDLSPEQLEARDDAGRLRFDAGNIAVHAIRRDFVEELTSDGLALPYHLARKKIPSVDPTTGARESRPGVKFETFVFDALERCERSIVLTVDRDEEFAPIKNAEGEDSPQSSRDAQVALAAAWLAKAGVSVPRDSVGSPRVRIEIAPERAIDSDELQESEIENLDFEDDVYLS